MSKRTLGGVAFVVFGLIASLSIAWFPFVVGTEQFTVLTKHTMSTIFLFINLLFWGNLLISLGTTVLDNCPAYPQQYLFPKLHNYFGWKE